MNGSARWFCMTILAGILAFPALTQEQPARPWLATQPNEPQPAQQEGPIMIRSVFGTDAQPAQQEGEVRLRMAQEAGQPRQAAPQGDPNSSPRPQQEAGQVIRLNSGTTGVTRPNPAPAPGSAVVQSTGSDARRLATVVTSGGTVEQMRSYVELVERYTSMSRDPAAAGVAAVVSASDVLRQRGPQEAIDYFNRILPSVRNEAVSRAIRIQLVDLYKSSNQPARALELLEKMMVEAQPTTQPAQPR
jgi:hypothetical protein